jgi:hypothetical protein
MFKHRRKDLNLDLIAQLADCGEIMPDTVRESILQRGNSVVPELIAILKTGELARDDAPGDGYVPIHAVKILAELRATQAIEPMIQLMSKCDSTDTLCNDLIRTLRGLGSPVLEPALLAHARVKTDEQRNAIADVLSGIGVRDRRIFSILVKLFQREPGLGAGLFVSYGDPEALPYLLDALDAYKGGARHGIRASAEIYEIACAIEELGGTLSKEQEELVESARNKQASQAKNMSFDRMLSALLDTKSES